MATHKLCPSGRYLFEIPSSFELERAKSALSGFQYGFEGEAKRNVSDVVLKRFCTQHHFLRFTCGTCLLVLHGVGSKGKMYEQRRVGRRTVSVQRHLPNSNGISTRCIWNIVGNEELTVVDEREHRTCVRKLDALDCFRFVGFEQKGMQTHRMQK